MNKKNKARACVGPRVAVEVVGLKWEIIHDKVQRKLSQGGCIIHGEHRLPYQEIRDGTTWVRGIFPSEKREKKGIFREEKGIFGHNASYSKTKIALIGFRPSWET